jgi:hypothetical protein
MQELCFTNYQMFSQRNGSAYAVVLKRRWAQANGRGTSSRWIFHCERTEANGEDCKAARKST